MAHFWGNLASKTPCDLAPRRVLAAQEVSSLPENEMHALIQDRKSIDEEGLDKSGKLAIQTV